MRACWGSDQSTCGVQLRLDESSGAGQIVPNRLWRKRRPETFSGWGGLSAWIPVSVDREPFVAAPTTRNHGVFRRPTRPPPACRETGKSWLGREDSNLRMAVPKTAALPLGYAPMRVDSGIGPTRDGVIESPPARCNTVVRRRHGCAWGAAIPVIVTLALKARRFGSTAASPHRRLACQVAGFSHDAAHALVPSHSMAMIRRLTTEPRSENCSGF